MTNPFKGLKEPAKNPPSSDLPEEEAVKVGPGKQTRAVPLENGTREDKVPDHNPRIEWPKAEPPEHKPMKLNK